MPGFQVSPLNSGLIVISFPIFSFLSLMLAFEKLLVGVSSTVRSLILLFGSPACPQLHGCSQHVFLHFCFASALINGNRPASESGPAVRL